MWESTEITRMWEGAWQDTLQGNRVRGISQILFCALCQSSIIARDNYSIAEVLATAFDNVRPTMFQDENARAVFLREIAKRSEGEAYNTNLQEALKVAYTIQDTTLHGFALWNIAPLLPMDQRLSVARSISDPEYHAYTLIDIARQWEGELRTTLLEEALEIAGLIDDPFFRAYVRREIAPLLPSERGIALADSIRNESQRAAALEAIAYFLPVEQAIEVIYSLKDGENRVGALVGLAQQHVGEVRAALLEKALEVTHSLGSLQDYGRAYSLVTIAQEWIGERRTALLSEALEVIRSIPNEMSRSSLLKRTAEHCDGHMSDVLLHNALELARSISNPSERSAILVAIAQRCEMGMRTLLLEEALESVKLIREDSSCALAILPIAEHSPNTWRIILLQEALKITNDIQSDSRRGTVLLALAPLLPIVQALEVACSITSHYSRSTAFQSIAERINTLTPSDLLDSQLLHQWHTTIQHIAKFPRGIFLHDLTALLPLTFALVDAEVSELHSSSKTLQKPSAQLTENLFKAVQEVASWWK